jgi:SAM-dependent methyltransferase
MDFIRHNQEAWDNLVLNKCTYTIPIGDDEIKKAKNGEVRLYLTPTKIVPKKWLPELKNKRILCLASGGGQQGPILACLGAIVTVFDNSYKQLENDQLVAKRENLIIETIQGDMRDLSIFGNETFDIIVHPVSNVFIDKIKDVWKESYRILKKPGILISGFMNPVQYIFDFEKMEKGKFEVKYSIPYSDIKDLSSDEINKKIENKTPFEFAHTIEDQIQGQIEAGFVITGLYEDNNGGREPIDKYIDTYLASKAEKKIIYREK